MGHGSIVLLDTHIWFWWLMLPHLLSKPAKKILDNSSELLVSVISCLEIATLVKKGRLTVSVDIEEWITEALKEERVVLAELTPRICVLSTNLPDFLHKDPADRILAATAKAHGVPLITKDEKLTEYPHVETIW